MRLRYLKGETMTVKWIDTTESSVFSPFGETTEERGNRLLNNPEYKGWFEAVAEKPVTLLKCDVCGMEVKSKAALGSHKRKHKEM